MEHFFYCRDEPGTEALLEELAEAHWSFMDGYAKAMIARGPTTDPEGEIHTGSMHMVDFPDSEAATVCAFEEPYYRAGVYAEVLKRRWRNVLRRTMWGFAGAEGLRRFLIIGHGADGIEEVRDELVAATPSAPTGRGISRPLHRARAAPVRRWRAVDGQRDAGGAPGSGIGGGDAGAGSLRPGRPVRPRRGAPLEVRRQTLAGELAGPATPMA